ncbi:MAG: histidine ammonia-lyase [Limisphaerales bacterium]|jgi:histidine ammonia-lyase
MKTTPYQITDSPLSISQLDQILSSGQEVVLGEAAKSRISNCRKWLETKMLAGGPPIYGVTTGFGSLCNISISPEESDSLQINLVRSHAVGTGPAISNRIAKLMLLLKAQSLNYGHSGACLSTAQQLLDFYNLDIIPEIPEQGSLGASGDLCPLAHMTLGLVGEGNIRTKDGIKPAAEVLKEHNLNPLDLKAKEGLALLNGTQFMGAYAVHCQLEAERLASLADLIAAISLDARMALSTSFHPLTHKIRNQKGQIRSAQRIRKWLEGSALLALPKTQVQDNYSFRCTPQVHGATLDTLVHSNSVITAEINAVTDNPLIFPEDDLIISGGNFHGQPLALVLDFMAIGVSELASIAERRTYRLLAGENGLPQFLVKESGLQSGLMIPQYTAAALVSQNKQLCTPASVDSIPSCNEQEDHVSMGANAATKLLRVIENTENVLAIAFMTAMQALEFRAEKSSDAIEKIKAEYRTRVAYLDKDRRIKPDMDETILFLRDIASSYH